MEAIDFAVVDMICLMITCMHITFNSDLFKLLSNDE